MIHRKLNIDREFYYEDVSERIYDSLIKSEEYEEVTVEMVDEMNKAITTGLPITSLQDLEGVKVVQADGTKKVKYIRKKKSIKPSTQMPC